ncbi:AraC family transcriptional regulator [Oceanispirochaeta sp. M1]|nr:AraC family transcriptional regulator [Oceanispirochaeta sp. M1]
MDKRDIMYPFRYIMIRISTMDNSKSSMCGSEKTSRRSGLSMPGYEEVTPCLEWLRPYVRQCGNSPRGNWKMERRRLLDFLLVYIEKGSGQFTVGPNGYDASAGDLFWIPPDTEHSMEGTGGVMVCPYIHFDLIYRYPESHWEFSIPSGVNNLDDYTPMAHPAIPESLFSRIPGRSRLYNHRQIGSLINTVCREAAVAHEAHTMALSGLMMQICTEILRGLNGKNETENERYIAVMEAASSFVQNNLAEELTVRDLAENANLSEAYFRRLFAAQYGLSPGRYIRQLRIARVKDLMTYTDNSLSEISLLCGFADVHSLSKAFKKAEGVSPREYRKFGRNLVFTSGREKAYPG